MKQFLILTCAALALASCDRPANNPPIEEAPLNEAFAHRISADQSGYYMPVDETEAGKWRLDHLFIGQTRDFEAWEAGTRSGTFGPVMLEFEDPTSPTTATELGEVHTGRVRVLPTAYVVTETEVTFAGASPELGVIRFEGRLDPDRLATARRNLGDEAAVMTGTLTVGDRSTPVSFRWWAGD